MFWIQLLKRVHRPLIVLATVTFIMVSASHPEIEFGDPVDDHNINNGIDSSSSSNSGGIFSDNDLLLSSTLVDSKHIPVPPIQQLPYCKGSNEKGSGAGEIHDSNSNSSDEVVIPSSSGELKPFQNGRQIVVATLDGKLSLLDHAGQILWSICTGQIFSSTISSVQLNENGKWVSLIPSLTGGLYKYDGDSLQPMPLNAESLLRRSFKLSNDVVMTGGKEVRTFGVDITSGSLRYECGLEGCSTTTKAESHQSDNVVLVVKKQLQTVRAIDSGTGAERWNFSVATHELALSGVTEGCYEGEQKIADQEHFVKVIIPEGIIISADQKSHNAWKHKFASPISQAWILENGQLTVIDPIQHSPVLNESPALYIGIHKQQFYVQESHTTADKLENAFAIQHARRDDISRPFAIGWKATSAIEGLHDNTALTKYKPGYPGFYIFEKDEVKSNNKHLPAIEGPPAHTSDNDSDDDDNNRRYEDGFTYFAAGTAHVIIGSLWYYWREVLGISLLTAVILNVLLMRPLLRAVRTQTVREMLAFFRNLTHKQHEEGLALVIPRKESDALELPSAHRARTRTTSSSSNASHLGIGDDSGVNFSSQYLREFDPIQCLGRGGFGVVFEAKKKIDDRHYAVKRIPLPNREKSREKVMREVRALAKLDHRNIVRYFSAWFENPPPNWLEKNDPLWSVSMVDASTANYFSSFARAGTDGGYQTNSVGGVNNCRVYRKDYSEISMPSKTPVDETMGEDTNGDSFIVFAAEGGDNSISKENVKMKTPPLRDEKLKSKARGWDDWSDSSDNLMYSKSSSPLLPLTVNDTSVSNRNNNSARGFFVRPTSLDIPSSVDDNDDCQLEYNKDCDNNNDEEEVEEVGEEATEDLCGPPSFIYLYIQQELCQKRTLQEWLRSTRNRQLQQVVHFFAQIVDAVEYIHLNKLIHRDLKPGNIFLASGVESEYRPADEDTITVLKVGDFGLATTAVSRLEKDALTPANEHPPDPVNLTGHVGTHLYMSPEQSQNKPYDLKVDIYSLGLIFFELLVPFSTEMERHEVLIKVRKMDFPTSFIKEHPTEYLLIADMVAHDSTKRPNATEVKNWVKFHLLKLTSEEACAPISPPRAFENMKSLSADTNLFSPRKGQKRFPSQEEKLLNKTQSCM